MEQEPSKSEPPETGAGYDDVDEVIPSPRITPLAPTSTDRTGCPTDSHSPRRLRKPCTLSPASSLEYFLGFRDQPTLLWC